MKKLVVIKFTLFAFLFGLLLTALPVESAKAGCWYEGPRWARIKVCNWEGFEPPEEQESSINPIVGPTIRQIYFKNDCHRPVKLAIRYQQSNDQWVTKYWYSIRGYGHTYLRSNSVRLATDNATFYYYAKVADGGTYYWAGSYMRNNLPMRMDQFSIDRDGDFTYRIHCS